MGEAQWVTIYLNNSSTAKTLVVKNVHLDYGKFYRDSKSACFFCPARHSSASSHILTTPACIDDKEAEIPTSDIEGTKIAPGDEFTVNSCGRSNSPSGTEGEFDVYEDGPGGPKVRHFYWNCPWGSPKNTWTISGMKHLLRVVHPFEQLDLRAA